MKVIGLDCAAVDAKVGLALELGLEVQQKPYAPVKGAATSVIAGWCVILESRY